MQIFSFGNTFIKCSIKSPHVGDSILLIDPYEVKTWGGRQPKMEAHVVLFSQKPKNAKLIPQNAFAITEPGEYETREISIYGSQVGVDKNVHTIYAFKAEGMTLVHLGHIPTTTIPDNAKELVEGADILFIPIGGDGTLSGKQAAQLVQELEPRVVIPTFWKFDGAKTTAHDAKEFLKELGNPKTEDTSKVSIKKKELPSDETKIMLLHP